MWKEKTSTEADRPKTSPPSDFTIFYIILPRCLSQPDSANKKRNFPELRSCRLFLRSFAQASNTIWILCSAVKVIISAGIKTEYESTSSRKVYSAALAKKHLVFVVGAIFLSQPWDLFEADCAHLQHGSHGPRARHGNSKPAMPPCWNEHKYHTRWAASCLHVTLKPGSGAVLSVTAMSHRKNCDQVSQKEPWPMFWVRFHTTSVPIVICKMCCFKLALPTSPGCRWSWSKCAAGATKTTQVSWQCRNLPPSACKLAESSADGGCLKRTTPKSSKLAWNFVHFNIKTHVFFWTSTAGSLKNQKRCFILFPQRPFVLQGLWTTIEKQAWPFLVEVQDEFPACQSAIDSGERPCSESSDPKWSNFRDHLTGGFNHSQPPDICWLVVGPPLWKIWKSIGMISNPIYGKIKLMFQTTNQICFSSKRRNKKLETTSDFTSTKRLIWDSW